MVTELIRAVSHSAGKFKQPIILEILATVAVDVYFGPTYIHSIYTLGMRAVNDLAGLRFSTGTPDPSLLKNAITHISTYVILH